MIGDKQVAGLQH